MKGNRLLRITPLLLASCLATEAFGAQRVFVRSNGTDTGSCTLNAPCRGFTYAMTQVDAGGEVVALDAAGYGTVTIDKSVTITTNSGFFAGISASTGAAITVNGEGIYVVLRNLNLTGLGALFGITVLQANSLVVENCVVSGFGHNGINAGSGVTTRIANSTVRGNGFSEGGSGIYFGSNSTASVDNVRLSNNAAAGVQADASVDGSVTRVGITDSDSSGSGMGYWVFANSETSATSQINIRRSSASKNIHGILVSNGSATATVAESSITFNEAGLNNGSGTLESFQNNHVQFNGTNVSGVVTPAMGQ